LYPGRGSALQHKRRASALPISTDDALIERDKHRQSRDNQRRCANLKASMNYPLPGLAVRQQAVLGNWLADAAAIPL